MLEPFLTCVSAIEGVVLVRVGLGFIVRVASDLERIVVALRCSEGREACGLSLDDAFLL